MSSTLDYASEVAGSFAAMQKSDLTASLLATLENEMAGSAPLSSCAETVEVIRPAPTVSSTRLTKKFEGDNWKVLVEGVPELLRRTFVVEACHALDVPPESISDLELRLGSLYVTFHVTHDEDITEDELERRIEEYPFHEMWRLYREGEGNVDGLDAALKRIKDLEQALKDKERELDKERDDNAQQIADLENQVADLEDELHNKAAQREQDLVNELGKEQQARKKAEGQLRGSEEEKKKHLENLKREKLRFEKAAQRQNELIAAIIQENKKEKEAKEREYNEELEVKDYVIENLKEQLRTRSNGEFFPQTSFDNDHAEEFSKLMGRMEEMAAVLQRSQEAETEARGEIQRLAEALRQSEEARQAENITYENNMTAIQQQLKAFRDTKLAEEHEKRAESRRSSGGANATKEMKENETIVRQYEAALQNIIGTLADRLRMLREEYSSYMKVSQQEIDNEKSILEEHEEDSKHIRQTFRQASLSLQKVFWNTREGEVPAIIQDLDAASANAEKSSAAVKVAVAMLDSKKKSFTEQREWMDAHQQSIKELIESLNTLNRRAFERQLALANNTVANKSSKP